MTIFKAQRILVVDVRDSIKQNAIPPILIGVPNNKVSTDHMRSVCAGVRQKAKAKENITRSAGRISSYFEDYYNHIYLTPKLISVGNLLEPITYTIDVYNSFFSTKQLLSFQGEQTDGIFHEALNMPVTIPALTSITFTITITLNGDSTINATYDYSFTAPSKNQQLKIIGSRILTWSIPPNWEETVEENLEWNTQILTARSGKEQRILLSPAKPRRTFSYLAFVHKEDINIIDSFVSSCGWRAFSTPLWWEKTRVTQPIEMGGTRIYCNTMNTELAIGEYAVVYINPQKAETVEIAGIDKAFIDIKYPFNKDYKNLLAYIIPSKICMLDSNTTYNMITDTVGVTNLHFTEITPIIIKEQPFLEQINGKQLFALSHNWVEDIKHNVQQDILIFDSQSGLPSWYPRKNHAIDTLELNIFLGNKKEIIRFKQWVSSVKGRAKSFYIRMQKQELFLAKNIMVGGTVFTIKNTSYGLYASKTINRTLLSMQLKNGEEMIFNVLDSLVNIDGTTDIITDYHFDNIITPMDIERICFILLVRSENDVFTIEYTTDEVAECILKLKGVIN